MKIQIIGLGVVGKAQAYLCHKLGHEVYGYDINHETCEYAKKIPKPMDADLTFICTPEQAVEKVIQTLVSDKIQGLYVIKSTVPVGTTERLMSKYKVHICHNPEFLREKHAFEDVVNPSRIVIGECCTAHGDILARLYEPLNKCIFRASPSESELIKLVSNSLRAINISFWNELNELCQKLKLNIEVVAEVADPAKVIGEWEGGKWGTRFFGKPYGGKCLPKDIKHLIAIFRQNGLNPHIPKAAVKVNRHVARSR